MKVEKNRKAKTHNHPFLNPKPHWSRVCLCTPNKLTRPSLDHWIPLSEEILWLSTATSHQTIRSSDHSQQLRNHQYQTFYGMITVFLKLPTLDSQLQEVTLDSPSATQRLIRASMTPAPWGTGFVMVFFKRIQRLVNVPLCFTSPYYKKGIFTSSPRNMNFWIGAVKEIPKSRDIYQALEFMGVMTSNLAEHFKKHVRNTWPWRILCCWNRWESRLERMAAI